MKSLPWLGSEISLGVGVQVTPKYTQSSSQNWEWSEYIIISITLTITIIIIIRLVLDIALCMACDVIFFRHYRNNKRPILTMVKNSYCPDCSKLQSISYFFYQIYTEIKNQLSRQNPLWVHRWCHHCFPLFQLPGRVDLSTPLSWSSLFDSRCSTH